ncbi:MAG: glycoside hydrolase family 3 N-terminal domain-containing protein [Candidatus Melainabacteria bacterium]|jgi:beta-N-acetylhexosaminidase
MSLDEKIGQLIMPAIVASSPTGKALQEIEANIQDYHVGSYHFLLDAKTLHNKADITSLIERMQEQSKLPLLLASDFEGGVGFYFKDATRFPRAMAIAATNNLSYSRAIGKAVARECKQMGIHINFYPTADVNNNPQNPIINIRSFGQNADSVGDMALAYMQGFQEEGLIATAKHFPGHGNVNCDSHLSLPVIDLSLVDLQKIELQPFRKLIDNGLRAVMSAHIVLPQIEDNNLPATLSHKLLTEILRKQLNFNGLIFTDAMMMNSISKNHPNGQASVLALKAGADIILFPPSVKETFEALKEAVKNGDLSEERINKSVERILKEKARLNLFISTFPTVQKASEEKHNFALADLVMEHAITLYKNENNFLPLKLKPNNKVLLINILDKADGWREGKPGQTLEKEIAFRHPSVKAFELTGESTDKEFENATKLTQISDTIIIATHVQVSAFKGSISLSEKEVNYINSLSKRHKQIVFILFGNPYLLTSFPFLHNSISTYECYPGAEKASTKALFGEMNFVGKLPVEIK